MGKIKSYLLPTLLTVLMFTCIMLVMGVAFAVDTIGDATSLSPGEWLQGALESGALWKGVSSMGKAWIITQILFKFFKTDMGFNLLGKLKPNVKFAVTGGITLIAGAVAISYETDVNLLTAVLNGSVLTFFAQYVYGLYERFIEKK